MRILRNVKQGTLSWEKLRQTRIGSSEVFDIVKYYATDDELQYCGFNSEKFRAEKPYTSVWALYHKILNDGIYKKEALLPEYAEYGHVAEPYGVRVLKKGREKRLSPGRVYLGERLIASLDIEGIAEEIDEVPFVYGGGTPKAGDRFVCEQKTMRPEMIKNGVPFKYIIQAQYQILKTKADFFILQLMVLDEDSPFIRGKICGMGSVARRKFLDEHLTVTHLYFKDNIHLGKLIEKCLDMFFADVDLFNEPKPFLENDSAKNIIESIRLNSLFNDKLILNYDLGEYLEAKAQEEETSKRRKEILQDILKTAKEGNGTRFRSDDGLMASFDKAGRFVVKIRNQQECKMQSAKCKMQKDETKKGELRRAIKTLSGKSSITRN